MDRRRLPSAGAVLAGTMICALVAAGIVAYLTYRDTSLYLEATRAVNREEEICLHLQDVRTAISDVAGAARGYVLAGDEQYLGSMDLIRQRIPQELSAAEAFVKQEYPDDLPLYSTLRQQIEVALKAVDEIIRVRRTMGFAEGLRTLLDLREIKLADNLSSLLDRMELNARLRLASKLAIERQRMRDGMRILIASAIVALFFIVLSGVLFDRYLAARREVEATVRRANEDLEARVQARTEALRQSESKFRLLSDAIPQIVWTASYPGSIQFLNQRWQEFTHLPPEEDREWRSIVHPGDIQAVDERWQAAVNDYTPFEVECRLRRHDGEYRWHLVRALPAGERAAAPLWFGTCTDIHAQKQAIESLVETNRNKEEFLAMLSHELRTPLTAAYGWTRLLQTKKLDDPGKQRAYDVIEGNIRIQTEIVERLLDVSQLISNSVRLRIAPVAMKTVVEQALEPFGADFQSKHLKLNVSVSEFTLEADAERLTQILKNLISNAVKFTTPGGTITISAEQQNGIAVLSVMDSGVGIEPEFLPHIFRHFRQADMRFTRRFGGLGLGLYIARRLAELHGGSIEVHSAGPNLGATFTVTLPLSHAHQPEQRHELPAAPRPNLSGLKIVVIERDAESREFIGNSLLQFGAQIINAASGADALEIVNNAGVDLILCDLAAAGNDGYWFIRQLRALPNRPISNLPCIGLSGSGEPERWLAAFAAGFDDLIAKPFQPQDLARTAEVALRVRAQV